MAANIRKTYESDQTGFIDRFIESNLNNKNDDKEEDIIGSNKGYRNKVSSKPKKNKYFHFNTR